MKEVSKDEYYNTIGPLDVVGSILNTGFPYTIVHRLRHSKQQIGRVVDYYDDIKQLKTKYFLK